MTARLPAALRVVVRICLPRRPRLRKPATCPCTFTAHTWAWDKKPKNAAFDAGTWRHRASRIRGDVGYIYFEAVDAWNGAGTLHDFLHALRAQGFHGQISVVGHSNRAALFMYFAGAQIGHFTGDAPISRFVALDAPVGLGYWTTAWRGWGSMPQFWAATSLSVASHHIHGVYAYDHWDALSGPYFGPGSYHDTWGGNPFSAHLYFVDNPDNYLIGSV